MAHYPFNSASLSFAGITSVEITSFQMDGGDRAEIDVTHSGSVVRETIPGFNSARRMTFGINYLGNASEFDALLIACTPAALVVQLGADCGTPANHFSFNAWLVSVSLNADLDGIVTGDLTFLLDDRPSE